MVRGILKWVQWEGVALVAVAFDPVPGWSVLCPFAFLEAAVGVLEFGFSSNRVRGFLRTSVFDNSLRSAAVPICCLAGYGVQSLTRVRQVFDHGRTSLDTHLLSPVWLLP